MTKTLRNIVQKQILKIMVAGLALYLALNAADIFTPKPQSRATANMLNGDLKDWETQQVVIKTARNVDNILYGIFMLYFVWWMCNTANGVKNEVEKQIINKGK